ncbi:flagellar filament capping protein FliD [Planomonospora parontospora]|uniref:flagellar filament capping protein FliD n=1 Tax=Planomonospora parontospora TaxID=58119 RepID=UPI001944DF40|nr:flagellar filament capping protein FliD [Planomonospora parontospora]GII20347.1 flagellar hook-associated protein 2 [Planomonospora parontospora subsp. antibiotica]
MAGSTVDGLVSGLSTSSLISQLMQVERAPQTQLKTKVSVQEKVKLAYQAINTKLAALKSSADDMLKATSWQLAKVSSSSTSVTPTTTPGAVPGSVTFNVTGVAKAQVSTAKYASATDPALAGGATKVSLTIGAAAAVDIDVTTNTPQGVADAINAKGLSVRASVLTTDQGTVLQLSSTKTGTASGFSITGLAGGAPTPVTPAADAKIEVGNPAAGGYTVTSASNAMTGVLTGTTINVTKLENNVTVTADADNEAVADKVKAFVDSANAVLSEIGTQTAYNAASKTKQPLSGNSTVRQMAQTILGQTGNGQTGYGSFSQFGVELDSTGKLTFDREQFLKAYAADPAKVMNAMTAEDPAVQVTTAPDGTQIPKSRVTAVMGLAERFSIIANNSTTAVTAAVKGSESLVTDLNKRIDAWDLRLERREAALRKQFTGLEVALGKLNQQSTWLSGQIASLPKPE